jgi:hypothetical protein
VDHRDDEKAVARVCNTSKGIVPRGKGSEDAEGTTGTQTGGLRTFGGVLQEGDAEHEEGEVEGEEEEEEGDCGFEGAEEEDGGEDEPTLRGKILVRLW